MTSKSKTPEKPYTFWELVLLSLFFPGAGQYFTGHTTKALLFAIPSAILFVDIVVHTFIVGQMVFAPVMAGEKLEVTDEAFNLARNLLVVIGIALLIWLAALVDTILNSQKLQARKPREDSQE
ncbi:MAG: hypothetical protein OEY50_12385 [Nitrospinota bacterium]|nr:hypothetical protein [Nitrospinota bacterium]MDH5678301.1 hypothetical protein [Nitrospinota bacterium]MDH5755870.1 hypothetical protein [Nitrospinota bacterium]